jgi:hypothetical protein
MIDAQFRHRSATLSGVCTSFGYGQACTFAQSPNAARVTRQLITPPGDLNLRDVRADELLQPAGVSSPHRRPKPDPSSATANTLSSSWLQPFRIPAMTIANPASGEQALVLLLHPLARLRKLPRNLLAVKGVAKTMVLISHRK